MEMKRIILFTFFLNLVFFCNAQELEVKSFAPKTNDLSASTNPRGDNNNIACALIKVQLAAQGAQFEGNVVGNVEYKTSEYMVYMASGSKRVKVKLEGYLPLEVNFADYGVNVLESKTTYVLTITGVQTIVVPQLEEKPEVIEAKPVVSAPVEPQSRQKNQISKKTFFTVNGAYSALPQLSFGVSVGQVKRFGWFVSAMTNASFVGMQTSNTCDSQGYLEGGYLPMYNGKTASDRLSVMGGGIIRLSGSVYARVGIGYGVSNLCWQTVDQKWYRNTEYCTQGLDLSAGFQAHLGGFVLSLEAVSTNFKTLEGKLGVGFAF